MRRLVRGATDGVWQCCAVEGGGPKIGDLQQLDDLQWKMDEYGWFRSILDGVFHGKSQSKMDDNYGQPYFRKPADSFATGKTGLVLLGKKKGVGVGGTKYKLRTETGITPSCQTRRAGGFWNKYFFGDMVIDRERERDGAKQTFF